MVIKSRRMRWAGHRPTARMGEMGNTYKILVGKQKAKRPIVRHKGKWENNFIRDLEETNRVCGCGMDLSGSG